MQTLTKEARAAACANGSLEVDISNCFPNCALQLYPDKDLRALRKYAANTQTWRMAVAEYYEVSIAQAKEVLTCALYGLTAPRGEISKPPHTIPLVEWLAEDAASVRRCICAERPGEMRHFTSNNRPSPEMTLFFYALSEVEAGMIAGLFRTSDINGRNVTGTYPTLGEARAIALARKGRGGKAGASGKMGAVSGI